MSQLPKGLFLPPGDTGGFLWNCDCSIWQKEPIWNFGVFLTIPISSFGRRGNVLCKLWVTRPLASSEFRLLQKCQQYLPPCWFGSKLIEHNQPPSVKNKRHFEQCQKSLRFWYKRDSLLPNLNRVAKTCQPVGANFSRPVLIFGQSTEKMLLAPVLQESSTDAGSRGASSTSSTRK